MIDITEMLAVSSLYPYKLDREVVLFEIDCLLGFAEEQIAKGNEAGPIWNMVAPIKIDPRIEGEPPYLYTVPAESMDRETCYRFMRRLARVIRAEAILSCNECWYISRPAKTAEEARAFAETLDMRKEQFIEERRECVMVSCHSQHLEHPRTAFEAEILREPGKLPMLCQWKARRAMEGQQYTILPTAQPVRVV